MSKELERDLGLAAVLAISIGAMIGSGIFILPALAFETAGPAVILAYLIAGLLVVPAAASKAEMATAMPEAGGTYLYIERAMGPLLGTIAGIGTWFALAFKGALALRGGVPYVTHYVDVPAVPLALALAVVLIALNLFGVKQTGRAQVAMVVALLAGLAWFLGGAGDSVDTVRYGGFLDAGPNSLLAATGLVFVSYAGVTKIASVAEEIERPDRNVPLGMFGSLGFTTVLYVLLVVVVVGVTDPAVLADTDVPMLEAGLETLGPVGIAAVVLAAMLALVSTANAGILSSSRYPFAMSRDSLAPPTFGDVSERFGTPITAIALTGGVMLVLIAFVPVLEIAKLASAFQILVFVLINGAVVAFRHAEREYDPSFEAPLYPYLQVVGIVGGLALIPFMGWGPTIGAAVITIGGLAWFYLYGRSRVDREGAVVDTVRRSAGRSAVERTESAMDGSGDHVLVALPEGTSLERERTLLRIGADVARRDGGRVTVVQFDEVHDQVPLEYASEVHSPADVEFEERTDELTEEFDVEIAYGEIVSHDTRHAVVNYARHEDADVLLMERYPGGLTPRLIGSPTGWILRHAHCDVALVEDRGIGDVEAVTVLADRSPYDPTKVRIADALAGELGATVRLVYGVDADPTSEQRATIEHYQAELAERCVATVTTEIVELAERPTDLIEVARTAELLVVSHEGRLLRRALSGQRTDEVIEAVDCTVVGVHVHGTSRPGLLGQLMERVTF